MGRLSSFSKAAGKTEFFGKMNCCISPGQVYRSFLSPTQQHGQQHRNPAPLPSGNLSIFLQTALFFCAKYKHPSLVSPEVNFGKGAALRTCECWSQDSHKPQTHYSQVPICVWLSMLHWCLQFLLESQDSGRADTEMVYAEKANGSWGIVCCPFTGALVHVLLLASMKVGSSLLICGLCCK